MDTPAWIGPYRIERLLGAGSFATVWLGHDPVLDSRVAIKVLAENWSHDLRVRERFLDEARLLRRLDHHRLVRVHGLGELPDGRPYAVLAWADGGSLRDRLARGAMPLAPALDLLVEIAAGVAVLHRHGVVHRDLTPANILFRSGPNGEWVLIADLGLAKAVAAASGLTARAGTPGYMAPEQDDPFAVVDTRADVFGLGRLGLRLLGTEVPVPSAASRLREGVPPQVAAVLRRATAPRPADRYPDAAAFGSALRRAVTPTGASAGAGRASGWQPGRRHRFGVVAAAVLVFVGLGGTAGDAAVVPRSRASWTSGPLTVALPAGWRAAGTGWAGQYGDDGRLEPALVMSPDPQRWAADTTLPGAFVGLSASIAARTSPEGFLTERPHGNCAAAPVRTTSQAGVDWVVAQFSCGRGRPVVVEAAGLGPGRSGLIYVQIAPPAGSGADFVDTLLAGVRVR
ncbi:serine/threonine-protein kinase [Micromonospora inositola]|uniref:non-specific serine/threonine protein kinase n=1 Tax=Micromonospora inositola TaxID=47865 RepID=A0A1C5JZC6_9ACTN|nr:serine/threonine-protein kinase [Micromonospora inositola]SCG75883.1 Serine/threonine protein kinase [Micromonospora inositola]